jgi:hypothetical protein
LSQGLEGPCPVDLLLSCEELVVVGRGGHLEPQQVVPGSQVVSADLKCDVLKPFALIAVVEIGLQVEHIRRRRIQINGHGRDDGLVVELTESRLVVQNALGGPGPNDPVRQVPLRLFGRGGLIPRPLDGLG